MQVVQRVMNQGVTLHNLLHNLHNLTANGGFDMVDPDKSQPRMDKKIVELINDRIDCLTNELMPDGDVNSHYEYHKRIIERKRAQDELKSELLKKGIIWAIGSICAVLGLALWEYIKHTLAK
ncbi:hypothetical protein CCP4SC76_730012 [Gammaproteobacteria bacterium]